MPLYMDLHIVPGVNAKDVADAHSRDVYLQKDHNCTCLTYWVDEQKGQVFCLIDAPSKEVVYELHTKSHGLIPHKIIEVEPDLVRSFLGRITDPENAQLTDNGLLLIDEPSFRIMMMIGLPDQLLIRYQQGAVAEHKLQKFILRINEQIVDRGGRIALQTKEGVIGSFKSAREALLTASDIYALLTDKLPYSIALHAGEPVARHDHFFGDALATLQYLCFFEQKFPIRITNIVRESLLDERELIPEIPICILSASDEKLIGHIISIIEGRYKEPGLQLDDFAKSLALSHSQLYRKMMAITGFSPNDFLRSFRLEKAKQQLQKGVRHIADVAFENGFNSPSYFTKCFKERFGLTPHEYCSLLLIS
ncbi:MAG: nickel-binding protein [Bacteroidota bacterium]